MSLQLERDYWQERKAGYRINARPSSPLRIPALY